ncbi:MAG: acyl-CoA/acyl-ACP dehydrogenase [Actinobacteria bacterium]|nr:acyl-CoA/acyl-ACP dehydrogenase [Actinomycetota bacterium]
MVRPDVDALRAAADQVVGDVRRAVDFAAQHGACFPFPGEGATDQRWAALAALGSCDLTLARVVEPHVDALAILHEAGITPPKGAWGVYAAEAPDAILTACERRPGDWRLTGTKPWCSLAGLVDRALVTARANEQRRLFAVDLHDPGASVMPAGWVSRGLRDVVSGPVHFADVPALPIGDAGWYVRRPGFAWGGIGVAACWFGGADALATTLRGALAGGSRDDVRLVNLGRIDARLHSARCTLAMAARAVDGRHDRTPVGGAADGVGEDGALNWALLAQRVRAVVAEAAEATLTEVGHALGPRPLAFDETHARRVADLEIYLRQHHADRDLQDIGRRLVSPSA